MNREYVFLKKQTYTIGEYSIVPLRDEDKFEIMEIRNEQIYHLRQKQPLAKKDQENYFLNVVEKLFKQQQPDQILFSYLENKKCIGYGGLVHVNWVDKNAEISFVMKKELENDFFFLHWGNFLNLIEKVAFEELGIHKIYSYAFDLRPDLYTALEAKQFKREANLKEHVLINEKYTDIIIHSKINANGR